MFRALHFKEESSEVFSPKAADYSVAKDAKDNEVKGNLCCDSL